MNGSQVFVGGAFKQAGSIVANNLAVWNGSKWSSVGGGVADAFSRGQVNAIAVSGKNLYVGGYFIQAGVTLANGLARWDGSSWSALSNQFGIASRGVHALAFSGSMLYIGGDIEYGINPDEAEFVAENIVALDTGTGHWSPLGDIASGIPLAFAVAGSTIYVGGDFTFAGGQNFGAIAAWDGATKSWSALGTNVNNSVNGEVYALAIDGGDLYLGGTFDHAAAIPANNLARWNASTNTWSDVGGGLSCSVCSSPIVTALVVNGGKLYAAGNFDTAGGVSVNNIAVWDEAAKTWSALGSPPFYHAHAMAFDASNNLYVTTTGALYKWDGANWVDLGGGGLVHGNASSILSVAVDGSDVYVGGTFQSVTDRATEIPANHVAKWNSTNGWSALGSGVSWPDGSGDVEALAVNGGNLYVGGSFSTAGGNPANAIAKWDGANWSTFDSGMSGRRISALSFLNGVLFAGGSFLQAGISPATNIAAWDGTRWVPLGGGVDFNRGYWIPRVDALVVNGTDLYVGGGFTTAGNKWSNDFARFDASAALPPPPIVTYEDSDVAVQYDTWRVLRDVDNWTDFSRISNHKGDTAQFTFTGKSVTWLTDKGPDKGQAQIAIDSANKGTFDLYSATASAFKHTFSGLSNASHKISVKVLGTKNASASDANVAVNGFLVGQSLVGSGDRRIQYNKWSGTVNSKASGGAYRSSPEKGSMATFTFVGTGVSWITMKGPAYGQAEVFLDDADRGKVDLYAPTTQAQRPVSYSGLSEGTHKLQIRVLGAKNAAATSTRVIVDAFQVTP